MPIPKRIHIVWIGNQSLKPTQCINSWKEMNPEYEVIVWDNEAFASVPWHNISLMYQMMHQEMCGVADMMRYEILYRFGGVALDADSFCVRPLEDWLLEPSEFSCWENELVRPGLIAVNAMGSVPESPFFGQVILDIAEASSVTHDRAWKTVGPLRITETWRKNRFPLTIYPSHYFIPNHFETDQYTGRAQVFANQFWSTTKGQYFDLKNKTNELLQRKA